MADVAEFARLYDEMQHFSEERRKLREEANKGFQAALEALWHKLYKRKKFNSLILMDQHGGEVERIKTEHLALAKPGLDPLDAKISSLDARLTEVAQEVVLVPLERPLDQWASFMTRSREEFSTQTNPLHYAKMAAEIEVEAVRQHGVPAVVVEGLAGGHGRFVVRVPLDEIGIRILLRKPGLPLREWLQLCWKRGVNPRVYNPFLAAGLEESLGLDYFGGEVRQAVQVQ